MTLAGYLDVYSIMNITSIVVFIVLEFKGLKRNYALYQNEYNA
jgi:hypothetical protein